MEWTAEDEQELRTLIIIDFRARGRRRYQGQCEGKQGYPTAAMAHRMCKHNDMQMFHCKFCGLWHVAHIDRQRRLRGKNTKEGKYRA